MKWPFRRKASWQQAFDEGWQLGSAGNIEAAIDKFRAAAQMAPTEPNPHYQLGFSHMLRHRYAEAVAPLRQADHLSRGFFLTQTYCYLCDRVLAGTISDDTVALLLTIQRSNDASRLDSPEGLALCERAVDTAPTCALAHYYYGKALFRADRQASESALRRCLELGPDDTTAIDALTHLGFHREAAGDLPSARALWQAALDRYPGNGHNVMTQLIIKQRFGAA